MIWLISSIVPPSVQNKEPFSRSFATYISPGNTCYWKLDDLSIRCSHRR